MSSTHRVIGVLALTEGLPSFGEPIFNFGDEQLYVQDVDPKSGRIRRFLKIETEDNLKPAKSGGVAVGDRPILAFLTSKSEPMVGRVEDIRDRLIEAIESSSTPVAVQMQIYNLIGDRPSTARTHRRLQITIADTSERAAQIFEREYAKSILWDELLKLDSPSLSDTSAQFIMSNADVAVRGGALVAVLSPELELLVADELETIRRSFAQTISKETQGDLFAEGPSSFLSSEDFDSHFGYDLARIRRVGRQEERLAIILKNVIENPKIGIPLMFSYKDSASFANNALSVAKSHLRESDTRADRIMTVARMIGPMYQIAFPMARGVLLMELARHLGGYPEIGGAIRQRLSQTSAKSILLYAPLIEQLITLAHSPTKGAVLEA